jgi:ABC-type molybdate transport system permease subunit
MRAKGDRLSLKRKKKATNAIQKKVNKYLLFSFVFSWFLAILSAWIAGHPVLIRPTPRGTMTRYR